MLPNAEQTPVIVDLGDARDVIGYDSSGSRNDGSGSASSHFKDPGGGAGETIGDEEEEEAEQ